MPLLTHRNAPSLACKALALGLTLAWAGSALAQSQTPTSLAGAKVIAVEEARKLADDKKATFIDTRNAMNFGKGHVPGARAVPYKGSSEDAADFDHAKDQFDIGKLPTAKDLPVVFYSDGPTGWKSYKAAAQAVKAGYKSVHYMRDGWSAWQAKGLPVEN
ncbi:MAG: rhodanese-like domain-containing protein [Vitreoscilla sp.]|nr:rhodanese-like domain-containing protein [Vitreoscilla sp.]